MTWKKDFNNGSTAQKGKNISFRLRRDIPLFFWQLLREDLVYAPFVLRPQMMKKW